MEEKNRKLSIIVSKGSLDMAYPGLVLANAARMLGIDADIFFTFWGMDVITKSKVDSLKVTPVGNPAMHMPNLIGVLPGISNLATGMMMKEIDRLDMPPAAASGLAIYMCAVAGLRSAAWLWICCVPA